MVSGSVIRVSDIDVSKLTFSEPQKLQSGGTTIYLKHNNEQLFVQFPAMKCPYGLSFYPLESKLDTAERCNLDVSMTGWDIVPNMKDAYNSLVGFESAILDKALENSQQWFKKKYNSKDVVQAIFTPLVKHSKDKETGEITNKYPPVIKVNIPKKNGKFELDVYNDKKEIVSFDSVNFKGAQVTVIAQITGIWIIAGKFGVTVKAKQMKVNPQQVIKGYAFMDDSDDDENESDM
jgi:hypothetical protein